MPIKSLIYLCIVRHTDLFFGTSRLVEFSLKFVYNLNSNLKRHSCMPHVQIYIFPNIQMYRTPHISGLGDTFQLKGNIRPTLLGTVQ